LNPVSDHTESHHRFVPGEFSACSVLYRPTKAYQGKGSSAQVQHIDHKTHAKISIQQHRLIRKLKVHVYTGKPKNPRFP